MKIFKHLWSKIYEPRVINFAYFCGYLLIIFMGVAIIKAPPGYIALFISKNLITYWGTFFVCGGFLGAISSLRGARYLERPAVVLCFTGFLVYFLGIVYTNIIGLVSSPTHLFFSSVICLIHFVVRWFLINKYAYDPNIRR